MTIAAYSRYIVLIRFGFCVNEIDILHIILVVIKLYYLIQLTKNVLRESGHLCLARFFPSDGISLTQVVN